MCVSRAAPSTEPSLEAAGVRLALPGRRRTAPSSETAAVSTPLSVTRWKLCPRGLCTSRRPRPHPSYPQRSPQWWRNDNPVVLHVRARSRACRGRRASLATASDASTSARSGRFPRTRITAGQKRHIAGFATSGPAACGAGPAGRSVGDGLRTRRRGCIGAPPPPPSVHSDPSLVHTQSASSPMPWRVIHNSLHSWGKPHRCSSCREDGAEAPWGPGGRAAARPRPVSRRGPARS